MKWIRRGLKEKKAALKAGLDPRTLRKYLLFGKVPSQVPRPPRSWRTRPDPFEPADLEWVYGVLKDAPELEAATLFEHLLEQHPGRYQEGQLRTFQRRVERWRATQGPPQEVRFAQVHRPGEAAQTDFLHVAGLEVTLAGVPVPPLLSHTVLPYSNVESATPCHSESMLAIRAGVQRAMFGWGHVPAWHQTDNSSAATHRLTEGKRAFNDDYVALMEHLGMKPRTIEIDAPEQNGDVESANGALRRALRQHLLLRGSREFADLAAWQAFVDEVVEKRNRRRQVRFLEELAVMTPLRVEPAPAYVELDAVVGSGSLLRLRENVYSVPSRLIGKQVRARMFEGHVEVWFGGVQQLVVPRLLGRGQQAINYRHIIWSLVRKPGAFARYRYREAMFPTLVFRQAFDTLEATLGAGTKADLEYLRILHLAASSMEADVEAAIELLMAEGKVPWLDSVRQLVAPTPHAPSNVEIGAPNLHDYDRLLAGGDR